MSRFILILNGPPFVGVELLLPKLADALGTTWLHIDPMSQFLEMGNAAPPDLAWGLADAITTAKRSADNRRSLVLGWRAPVAVYRRFERAFVGSGVFVAAVTFAPAPDEALAAASRYALTNAAQHEVTQFYRRGCHHLSAGIVWEALADRAEVVAPVVAGWLQRRISGSARGIRGDLR